MTFGFKYKNEINNGEKFKTGIMSFIFLNGSTEFFLPHRKLA